MTQVVEPVLSLRSRPQAAKRGDKLFRAQANRAVHDQALGSPLVVMPPTANAAAATAILMVALLCLAAWLVEVPQLVKGPGIIMPGEGLIPMAAPAAGHVSDVLIREKQHVSRGDVLIRLSGDSSAAGGTSHARLQLKSLMHEAELGEQSDEQRQHAGKRRIALIDARSALLTQQASSLRQELQARNSTIEIAERRVKRVSLLIDGGAVAPDQLDSIKGSVVVARVAVHELRNRMLRLTAEIEATSSERASELASLGLQSLEYEMSRERLQRDIQAMKIRIGRDVLAPQDGMVSRVRVVAGETVQQGQPLLTLQTGGATLEARLYIATGSGGTVRVGQTVELRIDAFPHQIYGTQRAVVESVSPFALHPADLRIPLAIAGPVFEVRARLLSREIVSANNRWPLVAGLSFQADIVQSKYRLYRWILRYALSPDSSAGV